MMRCVALTMTHVYFLPLILETAGPPIWFYEAHFGFDHGCVPMSLTAYAATWPPTQDVFPWPAHALQPKRMPPRPHRDFD